MQPVPCRSAMRQTGRSPISALLNCRLFVAEQPERADWDSVAGDRGTDPRRERLGTVPSHQVELAFKSSIMTTSSTMASKSARLPRNGRACSSSRCVGSPKTARAFKNWFLRPADRSRQRHIDRPPPHQPMFFRFDRPSRARSPSAAMIGAREASSISCRRIASRLRCSSSASRAADSAKRAAAAC